MSLHYQIAIGTVLNDKWIKGFRFIEPFQIPIFISNLVNFCTEAVMLGVIILKCLNRLLGCTEIYQLDFTCCNH